VNRETIFFAKSLSRQGTNFETENTGFESPTYVIAGHRDQFVKKPYVKPTVTTRFLDSSRDELRIDRAPQYGTINAGSRFAEKRSVPRYPFSGRAEVRELLARVQLAALVSEISVKGCYLESVDRLPKNTVVQIVIHRDDSTFVSWGRVVYVHSGVGSGVAFFDTVPAQQKQIERWVAEISHYLDGNSQAGK
jgi:hypothetical protein